MRLPALPWWHPERYARRRPYLLGRTRVLRAIRNWFVAEDFVEVETPALQISPGLEVHLHAFATAWQDRLEGAEVPLYLHTSPEFSMKKLLVAGEVRLFQLAHVFRNGERSPTHHPEFTMLEWYRARANCADLMCDCITLIRQAFAATGRHTAQFRGQSCDPFADWETLTVAEAFQHYAGIDLLASLNDPAHPDGPALAAAAIAAGVVPHSGDSWDDIFFRILLERVEPHLGQNRPTFLSQYPAPLACLARPHPQDPRVAERFELYICGVELANAFGELTDATVQRQRFHADIAEKERLYGVRYPLDEDFLAALAFGMPDSAGIALGIDRLVMLCTGAEELDDVLWAPVAVR